LDEGNSEVSGSSESNGSTALITTLCFVVLLIIAVGLYFAWRKYKDSQSNAVTPLAGSQKKDKNFKEPTPHPVTTIIEVSEDHSENQATERSNKKQQQRLQTEEPLKN